MNDQKMTYEYIPVEVSELLKQHTCIEDLKSEIKKKYEDRAKWFIQDLEMLEDAASRFKAVGLIHKASMEEALKAQDKVLMDLGATIGDAQHNALKLLTGVESKLKSIKETCQEINKLSTDARLWQTDKIVETIEMVNRMDKDTKNLLGKILSSKNGE